jgi:hypothetical protein
MTAWRHRRRKDIKVECHLREVLIARIAPITSHLVLSVTIETALGLPRAYRGPVTAYLRLSGKLAVRYHSPHCKMK